MLFRVRRGPVPLRLGCVFSRPAKVHLAAAVLACLLLPAWSRAAGDGGLAWTMFSRSDSFRLSLRATDRAGAVHILHPAELAPLSEPALRFYLSGADRFHTWPVGATFQARLPALAGLACSLGAYASVQLTLEQRRTLDAPVRVTHARASCPGG